MEIYREMTSDLHTEIMIINMGPSHPATHGVLRLVLQLDGEKIIKATPDLGYLHRGKEKIAENKTYHQFIPYTDRLDYLSPLSNNIGYVMAVEKLLGIEVPIRAQYIRTILCEMARISSHLLWLGTAALDIGAATVFFHTFRERETLYDLFEMLTGSRMHTSFPRIGGLPDDLPDDFIPDLKKFLDEFPSRVDGYETLLSRNRIWMDRTGGVGVISAGDAVDMGMTGPILRATGVSWDLRKDMPYLVYDRMDFEVPVGENGDAYDRYLVRVSEMRQSHKIVCQALEQLPSGPIYADAPHVVLAQKERVYTRMEELIQQFKIVVDSPTPPVGEVYSAIEAPKGELGFYIVSDGSNKPYRLKIRAPSFVNLQALPKMTEGGLFADVIVVIGSLDPVMGETDK